MSGVSKVTLFLDSQTRSITIKNFEGHTKIRLRSQFLMTKSSQEKFPHPGICGGLLEQVHA